MGILTQLTTGEDGRWRELVWASEPVEGPMAMDGPRWSIVRPDRVDSCTRYPDLGHVGKVAQNECVCVCDSRVLARPVV